MLLSATISVCVARQVSHGWKERPSTRPMQMIAVLSLLLLMQSSSVPQTQSESLDFRGLHLGTSLSEWAGGAERMEFLCGTHSERKAAASPPNIGWLSVGEVAAGVIQCSRSRFDIEGNQMFDLDLRFSPLGDGTHRLYRISFDVHAPALLPERRNLVRGMSRALRSRFGEPSYDDGNHTIWTRGDQQIRITISGKVSYIDNKADGLIYDAQKTKDGLVPELRM